MTKKSDIIEMAQAHPTMHTTEIAQHLGCDAKYTYHVLWETGLMSTRYHTWALRRLSPKQISEVLRLSDSGVSYRKIGEKVGVSASAVWKVLRKNGRISRRLEATT